MWKKGRTVNPNRDAEGFEIEGEPEGKQVDTIWERDGRGNIIVREVPDDADD
jgi:hypothetical protein